MRIAYERVLVLAVHCTIDMRPATTHINKVSYSKTVLAR